MVRNIGNYNCLLNLNIKILLLRGKTPTPKNCTPGLTVWPAAGRTSKRRAMRRRRPQGDCLVDHSTPDARLV